MLSSQRDRNDVPEIDLTDPEVLRDPFAAYGRARERSPVARLLAPGFGPMWALTRHEDARAMLADPRFQLNAASYMRPDAPEDCLAYMRTMQEMDGPEHTRLRRLVSPAFTARRAAEFRPRIGQVVEQVLDDLPDYAEGGSVDLLRHCARPLPIDVICELVGIPEPDRPRWREYGAAVAAGWGQAFAEAIPGIMDGAKAAVAHRRAQPGDDLIADLLRTQAEDGDRLSDSEMVTLVWHLVLAGQTPTNLIANAVETLLANPDQLAALRDDPGLMPRAVEELLRWCGPQLLTIPRYTREDIEIGGVLVGKGEPVTAAIVSANRDPRAFADPDRLDISRAAGPAPPVPWRVVGQRDPPPGEQRGQDPDVVTLGAWRPGVRPAWSLVGTEQHGVFVQDEVHRQRDRSMVIDQYEATQVLPGQQPKALILGQLLPADLVPSSPPRARCAPSAASHPSQAGLTEPADPGANGRPAVGHPAGAAVAAVAAIECPDCEVGGWVLGDQDRDRTAAERASGRHPIVVSRPPGGRTSRRPRWYRRADPARRRCGG